MMRRSARQSPGLVKGAKPKPRKDRSKRATQGRRTSPYRSNWLEPEPYGPLVLFTSFVTEHSHWRVELLSNGHSTLHAFFLAAKERGHSEFQLQLITNPKGRIEFSISPRGHSEMSANFEVRGNMVRAAAKDESIVPTTDDTDALINFGGTRSGEKPVQP
jgi:hypothetical protein